MNRKYFQNNSKPIYKMSEEKREYHRDYYDKHKDKYRKYSKDRQAKARLIPGVREKMRISSLKSQHSARRSVIDHYGGKCSCCGESHYEFLAIDHINGGGTRLRREKIESSRLYYEIRRKAFPDTYRVLCHNCNSSLGSYGYCPHKFSKDGEWLS